MKKDYAGWMNLKSTLNNDKLSRALYHEREVWWVSIGVNVGYEEDGKGPLSLRPVLILKRFNSNLFIGVPLSTKVKKARYLYGFTFNSKPSVALLSQTRPFDSLRLVRRMGKIPPKEFIVIREKLFALLM